ncbi:MAG: Thymidylate synthase thyX [Chloroflexi bacterium]|nr:Thymidylate synthase thyX [Chloroflexota bacterium]
MYGGIGSHFRLTTESATATACLIMVQPRPGNVAQPLQARAADEENVPDNDRRVFSVIGTLPEPDGYAVAKFSRSARPYEDWIKELTQEGASRFYEQFYFSYGHASIADLAHLTMVAENISIVAAVEVLDEQLVDAQESSTRYQDFSKRRFYTPPEIASSRLSAQYEQTCDRLFEAYRTVHGLVTQHFERRYASKRPAEMADDEYRRTLRARAFDVARYLLPSSTLTGLGYLCSARTLERQITRLASSPLAEVREIADGLRAAAVRPALNPLAERVAGPLGELLASHPNEESEALGEAIKKAALTGAAAAPTLVRYTEASPYLQSTYAELRTTAEGLLRDTLADGARGVELATSVDPRTELAATLLYRGGDQSYRQILDCLRALPDDQLESICGLAFKHRGQHDDVVREARVGYQLVFDACLDNGAFRDLHRHRNCVQIVKDFNGHYGYDQPDAAEEAGAADIYRAAMDEAGTLAERLDQEHRGLGQYVLPLGYRRRALFKMDFAELAYIVETRTTPAGHFSYRDIASQMCDQFARRFPALASQIRATDARVEEFFER